MANIKINYISRGEKLIALRDKDATKLIIHKNITHICNWAFIKCANLKKLVIPDHVKKVDRWAFVNSFIEEVSIPKHLEDKINKDFFSNENVKIKVRMKYNIDKAINLEVSFNKILTGNLGAFKDEKEDLTFLDFLEYLKELKIITSAWRFNTEKNKRLFELKKTKL